MVSQERRVPAELLRDIPEGLWWIHNPGPGVVGFVRNGVAILPVWETEADALHALYVRPPRWMGPGKVVKPVALERALEIARTRPDLTRGRLLDCVALLDREWNEIARRYVR